MVLITATFEHQFFNKKKEDKNIMGRKSGSHTVATMYINIHTVSKVKQKPENKT